MTNTSSVYACALVLLVAMPASALAQRAPAGRPQAQAQPARPAPVARPAPAMRAAPPPRAAAPATSGFDFNHDINARPAPVQRQAAPQPVAPARPVVPPQRTTPQQQPPAAALRPTTPPRTVPQRSTTAPQRSTAVPQRSTAPQRSTTVPQRSTTVPQRSTTVPQRSTTVPQRTARAAQNRSIPYRRAPYTAAASGGPYRGRFHGPVVRNQHAPGGNWGWNHGVAWRAAPAYWGGGFWGPFSLADLAGDLIYGSIDDEQDQLSYPSYEVEPDSPGAELLQDYALQQTQCGPADLVVIWGPDDSVICAFPNDSVAPGNYEVDPTTFTLVPAT